MEEQRSWIIEEIKSTDFGDKRLNKRYGDLLSSFTGSPDKTIPASCQGWKETIAASSKPFKSVS